MDKQDIKKEIAAIQETVILQLESIITDAKEINSMLKSENLTINDLNDIKDSLESLNNKLEYIESLNKIIK